MRVVLLQEYLDLTGQNQYQRWFDRLDVSSATKVTTALERLAQGNKSSIKTVGEGVSEYRIDFGPGYRIYFGRDGDRLIILLGGGSKKRQSRDIAGAKAAWQEYKLRRRTAAKAASTRTAGQNDR